ncbi:MAG: hypothetical protein ACM3ZB_12540 [bacterium]
MRKFLAVLVSAFVLPALLAAQQHVVSPGELRSDVQAAGAARQRNAEKVRSFLKSGTAQEALSKARLNAGKIDTAIASLSDEELASLAAKSEKIQNDFAAGRLTNSQVTYIILGTILIVVVAILA